jgi:predicted  nucleic acid-binding Zn-ribbon protein
MHEISNVPAWPTCYDRNDLSLDGSTQQRIAERRVKRKEESSMDLVSNGPRTGGEPTSGAFVGAGSFCCRNCGYVLTLSGDDTLSNCPGCGGNDFVRASLFSSEPDSARVASGEHTARHGGVLSEPAPLEREEMVAEAHREIVQPGEYLCFLDGAETRTVALSREWTRIGRSLAADVRFDDPTVSRRHALIVRQPDGVRVLDDRSLNGVFVNGQRIDGKLLQDGDEIIVGRYRLSYLVVAP